MEEIIKIILTDLLAVICILIMKKIEPDNKWYPVYAIVVMVLFTFFSTYLIL